MEAHLALRLALQKIICHVPRSYSTAMGIGKVQTLHQGMTEMVHDVVVLSLRIRYEGVVVSRSEHLQVCAIPSLDRKNHGLEQFEQFLVLPGKY